MLNPKDLKDVIRDTEISANNINKVKTNKELHSCKEVTHRAQTFKKQTLVIS